MTGLLLAWAFREASRWIGVALVLVSIALLLRIDVLTEMGREIPRRALMVTTIVTLVVGMLLLYRFERLVG